MPVDEEAELVRKGKPRIIFKSFDDLRTLIWENGKVRQRRLADLFKQHYDDNIESLIPSEGFLKWR